MYRSVLRLPKLIQSNERSHEHFPTVPICQKKKRSQPCMTVASKNRLRCLSGHFLKNIGFRRVAIKTTSGCWEDYNHRRTYRPTLNDSEEINLIHSGNRALHSPPARKAWSYQSTPYLENTVTAWSQQLAPGNVLCPHMKSTFNSTKPKSSRIILPTL